MVAAEDGDASRIADFEGEKQTDGSMEKYPRST